MEPGRPDNDAALVRPAHVVLILTDRPRAVDIASGGFPKTEARQSRRTRERGGA